MKIQLKFCRSSICVFRIFIFINYPNYFIAKVFLFALFDDCLLILNILNFKSSLKFWYLNIFLNTSSFKLNKNLDIIGKTSSLKAIKVHLKLCADLQLEKFEKALSVRTIVRNFYTIFIFITFYLILLSLSLIGY